VKMGLPSHGTGGEAGRRNASQFERARQSGALARYGDAESLLRGTRASSLKPFFRYYDVHWFMHLTKCSGS
jgi:hypothetical protein